MNVSKKFLLKKLIKWKRPLLTYLEKRNWWKLSEVSRFVRSFTKGFEKKMLWKMHVMESQRHWNLLKPVIIFISTLLGVIQKVRSLKRGEGRGGGVSHLKANKNEKGGWLWFLACMYVCVFKKNAEIFKMKFFSSFSYWL